MGVENLIKWKVNFVNKFNLFLAWKIISATMKTTQAFYDALHNVLLYAF